MVSRKHKARTFIFFILLLLAGLIFWRLQQSETLKRQADKLVKEGRPEEAIILYTQAHSVFPLRWDVVDNLEGAKLIFQSDIDYGKVYQLDAQIQEEPPIAELPPVELAPEEVFVPILMYHHIRINPRPRDPVWAALNVSPQQLEEQFNYLVSSNFHAVSLDDLYSNLQGGKALPSNPIVLTFDDGYSSFYEAAFPLLQKYHLKATEFVITGVVDASPYLTWNQIAEMDKSGLVEFGAHTLHHSNLPSLSAKSINYEITGSKKDLEAHLKKPIHWFAYPYGSYNNFIIQAVQDAGFLGAASTIYGVVQSKNKLYLLPRIMVDGRFSLDNIARRIQR